jgi:hypothetical protein
VRFSTAYSALGQIRLNIPPFLITNSQQQNSITNNMSASGGELSTFRNHGSRIQPCKICQQRKVKCDRKDPCTNCLKAGEECVLPPPKRKKAAPHYSDLLIRLKRYEDALRNCGADVEQIARGGKLSRDRLSVRHESSQNRAREVSPYLEKYVWTSV